MKKIMVIALALIMMLSCIACANNAADNSAANGSDETPVLKVALSPDFAPMEFVDTAKEGQEQFVGFDVTLAKHIAEQLGMKLEIEPMSFDACQVAVQMGNVDLGISGFSWTAERAENYLISDYYIAGDNETKQTIIVAADKAGQYTKAEDFAGMKIGAQAASLQELLCNEALPEDATVELFKDINVAVVALQTGKVDGVAVADGNAEAIMANNQDIGKSGFFFDVDPKYENNVILLNKKDEELLKKVNDILADCMANDMYSGWYEDAKKLAGIDTAQEISYTDDGKAQ
mgnify:FL=1